MTRDVFGDMQPEVDKRSGTSGVYVATALVLLALIALALLLALHKLSRIENAILAPPTPGDVPRWEYLIASPPDGEFARLMAQYGNEGWELVAARRASDRSAEVMSYEMIFKRRKPMNPK